MLNIHIIHFIIYIYATTKGFGMRDRNRSEKFRKVWTSLRFERLQLI